MALCTGDSAAIFKFVGYVLMVFKIAIPLLIIGFGMFDFGKAVTSGKDDDIKKSAKTLLIRAVAGVIIFFVPTIVMWLFGTIINYDKMKSNAENDKNINWANCENCILRPWTDKCVTNDGDEDASSSSSSNSYVDSGKINRGYNSKMDKPMIIDR